MIAVFAFVGGCITGWISYRFFWKYGMSLAGKDADSARALVDKLGYSSLIKLRTAIDQELEKRRPPAISDGGDGDK